jgi:hypothetical protein
MAVLVIEKGKQQGLRFEVPDDAHPTVLGRDHSVDVVLDDERSSRQHARIVRRLGRWVLEDLGSRNGILMQGRMVREAVIADGDIFQIGSTVLALREGERIDPLSGMEVAGARLLRLLRDEAGILTYRAVQLAMDRPVRVDILHPRWALVTGEDGQSGATHLAHLVPGLRAAAEAAAGIGHPRVNGLLRAEFPDDRGGGFAFLRLCEAPTLADGLAEVLALPFPARSVFFRRLAEAILARSADPLGYPIGLRHVQVDPQEGPVVQAFEASALIALLRGCAKDLPAFIPYLAPEQAEKGAGPSRPAAIYNLAALGYHILTGIPPMGQGTAEEILERHRTLPPAPADLSCPDVPASLGNLLSAMLEKDPARRPVSGEEILAMISGGVLPPRSPRPSRAPSCSGRCPDVKEEAGTPRKAPQAAAAPASPPSPTPQAARPASGRIPRPATAAQAAGRQPERSAGTPARGTARPASRSPAPSAPPAPVEEDQRMPVAVQIFFWPALWAGLFFGGRWLIGAILKELGR